MGLGLLTLPAVLLLLCGWRAECTAGFIKSPISEVGLTGEAVELHCEAIGRPIPEIQWWFEADYSNNESFSQLWDGAREERVQINATYISHATSTLYVISLIPEDSGTYECRASNDPDRNHLTKIPRIKWIRSQANVMVIDREWEYLNSSHYPSTPSPDFYCLGKPLAHLTWNPSPVA